MFYRIAMFAVNLLWHLWFDLRLEGKENIPHHGGYILAGNHVSAMDPTVVCLGVRPRWGKLHFMAKAELFDIWGLRVIIRWLCAFPVARGKGDQTAIHTAYQVLEEGEILGIFPEGTRSKDGELLRFKSGLALIAGHTQSPILPVVITYSPKKSFRSRVVVRYGKPLSIEELGLVGFNLEAPDARALKDATRRTHAVMEEMLRQNQRELGLPIPTQEEE